MLQSSGTLLLVSALLLILLLFLGLDLFRVRQRLRRFEQDLSQLRAAAPQVGRAEAQEASLNRLMVDLTRLTERLQTARDARMIPQVLVHLLQRTFEAEQVLVLFTRRSREPSARPSLVVVAASSGAAERAMNETIAFGEGELGLVAQLQEAMDHQDFELRAVPRHATVPGLRSFRTDLASPMIVGGETFGVVALSGLDRHFKNEKGMLTLVAQTAGFGLQSAVSYSELKNRADIDGLTRILNRQALTERLGELVFDAERSGHNVGVFMFDVDNFKHYNDRNGHAAGDRVLKGICDVVADAIRAEDVFGRIGGEEFVVVSPNQSVASTYGLAEKLRRAVEDHTFEHGAEQPLGKVTVSGGVAVFPGHARDSNELLRHADEALYRAKAAGRNRVEIAVPQSSSSR
jgi:diguanylate cyclase (GGDEF)-like protein